MKIFIRLSTLVLLLACLCFKSSYSQLKIVDKETKKGISYPNIVFLKSNFSINADKEGQLDLPKALDITDSIIICKQGYKTFSGIVSDIKYSESIQLSKKMIKSEELGTLDARKLKNSIVLNEFSENQIHYYVGLEKPMEQFNYLQIAQRFSNPTARGILKSVTINRLILNNVSIDEPNRLTQARFLLRVYDSNEQNLGPGKDLISDEILIDNANSRQIKIDLSKYNIIVKNIFFVAVEWLRIPENSQMSIANPDGSIFYGPKMVVTGLKVMHQPFIGMSNIKGKEGNAWAMNFNHQWEKYQYFLPELTDFSIAATIKY